MYDSEQQKWLDTLQEPVPQTKIREKISYQYTSLNNFQGTTQIRVDLSALDFYLWSPKKTMYSAAIYNKHFINAVFIPAQPFATAPGYLKGPCTHWFTWWTLFASVVNFDLINIRNARGDVYCRNIVSDVREILHRYGICFWMKPAFQLKTTHARTYVYINFFICFSVKNPLLKLVLPFQIRPVHRAGSTKNRVEVNNKSRDLLTYSLTHSMEQSPSWEASHEILLFYGTRRFISGFTSARHLSQSRASSIQSIPPYPTSCRSILTTSIYA